MLSLVVGRGSAQTECLGEACVKVHFQIPFFIRQDPIDPKAHGPGNAWLEANCKCCKEPPSLEISDSRSKQSAFWPVQHPALPATENLAACAMFVESSDLSLPAGSGRPQSILSTIQFFEAPKVLRFIKQHLKGIDKTCKHSCTTKKESVRAMTSSSVSWLRIVTSKSIG